MLVSGRDIPDINGSYGKDCSWHLFVTATTLPTVCTKCSQGSQSAYGKTNSKLEPNSIIQSLQDIISKTLECVFWICFFFISKYSWSPRRGQPIYHNLPQLPISLLHLAGFPKKNLALCHFTPIQIQGVCWPVIFSGWKNSPPSQDPESQTPHLPWKLAWKERCPWWSMQNGPRPRRLTRFGIYLGGMMDRTRTDINIMFNPFRIHGNWYINPTTSLLFIKINQL